MVCLGCAGALGYGAIKVVWALGDTVGIRNPNHYHAVPNGFSSAGQRFFDAWGTPILAGFAIVILLGLVYPWASRPILRPPLRTCAWAGAPLMGGWGVVGLILTILYIAGDHSAMGIGDLDPPEARLTVASNDVEEVNDLTLDDAVVLGSAAYMDNRLGSARQFVTDPSGERSARSTAVFSSGPIGDPPRPAPERAVSIDAITREHHAKGPPPFSGQARPPPAEPPRTSRRYGCSCCRGRLPRLGRGSELGR